MDRPELYNPLDKINIGKSVAEALLSEPIVSLTNLQTFEGAGIYAIYYSGAFTPYEAISASDRGDQYRRPVYVGKAIPAGARKGGVGLDTKPGTAMFNRLKDHLKSIEQATNLNVADFDCRFLLVDDIWIPLGESLLIARFSPPWNMFLDGFGNHDPGSGRYNQLRSRWDVLHPGRSWAEKCKPRTEAPEQIEAAVIEFLMRSPT